MLVKLNFNLQAWIANLEIEADSIEEAKEKLYKMDVFDLVNEGHVKETDISDIDAEIAEAEYTVKAYNIDYDVTGFDVDTFGTMSDEEVDAKIQEVKDSLPKELILTVSSKPSDLDDYVADAIADETEWLVNGCFYEILNTK